MKLPREQIAQPRRRRGVDDRDHVQPGLHVVQLRRVLQALAKPVHRPDQHAAVRLVEVMKLADQTDQPSGPAAVQQQGNQPPKRSAVRRGQRIDHGRVRHRVGQGRDPLKMGGELAHGDA